jgi:hypothetical protein
VLGKEHPYTLRSIHNFMSTHSGQGRWNKADELGKQVIEARTRVLGKGHPGTLMSMHNLAFTWKSQGRRDDAVALLAKCIRLRKAELKIDHPDITSYISTLRN